MAVFYFSILGQERRRQDHRRKVMSIHHATETQQELNRPLEGGLASGLMETHIMLPCRRLIV